MSRTRFIIYILLLLSDENRMHFELLTFIYNSVPQHIIHLQHRAILANENTCYNIMNIDRLQGATKLTKDDIERVFSLYDRVSKVYM